MCAVQWSDGVVTMFRQKHVVDYSGTGPNFFSPLFAFMLKILNASKCILMITRTYFYSSNKYNAGLALLEAHFLQYCGINNSAEI